MAIKPGQAATVTLSYMMHGDMGGQHQFAVHLMTNDPAEPEKILTVLSNWVP